MAGFLPNHLYTQVSSQFYGSSGTCRDKVPLVRIKEDHTRDIWVTPTGARLEAATGGLYNRQGIATSQQDRVQMDQAMALINQSTE